MFLGTVPGGERGTILESVNMRQSCCHPGYKITHTRITPSVRNSLLEMRCGTLACDKQYRVTCHVVTVGALSYLPSTVAWSSWRRNDHVPIPGFKAPLHLNLCTAAAMPAVGGEEQSAKCCSPDNCGLNTNPLSIYKVAARYCAERLQSPRIRLPRRHRRFSSLSLCLLWLALSIWHRHLAVDVA